MNKSLCVVAISTLFSGTQVVWAKPLCSFIAEAKTGKVLLQQGDACHERITPASTFKIAISLMAFDAGILKDQQQPVWSFQPSYPDWGGDVWKTDITPSTWMKYSVFWYSQQAVEKLGQKRFEHYLQRFDYGNKDVSAVPVKSAGQSGAWVISSLQISALEQASFLTKVVNRQLSLRPHAYDMTEQLIRYDDQPNGWTVYGKTGTGSPGTDGHYDASRAYGWYVGWARKDEQEIVFVELEQDENAQKTNAGLRAREHLLQRLATNF